MWLRLSDEFADDPRLIEAGGDAGWLHVCALVYAARYATDGRVPKAMISRLTDRAEPDSLASRLVDLGVWRDVGSSFELTDYLKWNPPRAEVERIQKNRQRAGRVGAENRWHAKTDPPKQKAKGKATAMAGAKGNGKAPALTKPWPADKDKDKDLAPKLDVGLESFEQCRFASKFGPVCVLEAGHSSVREGARYHEEGFHDFRERREAHA